MPIYIIKAIAPSILLLALLVPLVRGIRGESLASSLMLGWLLLVISFLFQDIFSVLIAKFFLGNEGITAVAVDQPGTVGALFIGWLPSLISYYLGLGVAKLWKR